MSFPAKSPTDPLASIQGAIPSEKFGRMQRGVGRIERCKSGQGRRYRPAASRISWRQIPRRAPKHLAAFR
jgi:hypothetical protein